MVWLSMALAAAPAAEGDLLITELMVQPVEVPDYFGQWDVATPFSSR